MSPSLPIVTCITMFISAIVCNAMNTSVETSPMPNINSTMIYTTDISHYQSTANIYTTSVTDEIVPDVQSETEAFWIRFTTNEVYGYNTLFLTICAFLLICTFCSVSLFLCFKQTQYIKLRKRSSEDIPIFPVHRPTFGGLSHSRPSHAYPSNRKLSHTDHAIFVYNI